MDELVSKEKLIATLANKGLHYVGGVKGFLEIRNIIKTAPKVDAQPVIRCKDCDYFIKGGIYNGCDFLEGYSPNEDDYCSNAITAGS